MNHELAQLGHRELFRRMAVTPDDREITQEFIMRYNAMIRQNVTRAVLGAGSDAHLLLQVDDVVNTIYCRLFQHNRKALRSFRGCHENSVFAYLHAICRNTVCRQMHEATRRSLHAGAWPVRDLAAGGDDRLFPAREARPSLLTTGGTSAVEGRVLADMIRMRFPRSFFAPHARRNHLIFKLHFVHGYHCHEIARIQALGLGESGVANAAARMRRWLRREFVPRGDAL